jgi:formaldehyde-activating enzyme
VRVQVSIAARGSATAATIIGALTQPSLRYSPALVTVGSCYQIRPATVLVHHTPIGTPRLTSLTTGPVRLGVAAGVLDAVAAGHLPQRLADELVVLAAVTIDPELENHPVDDATTAAVQASARLAVAGACAAAVTATPNLVMDEMVATRNELDTIR